jgi:hypothetical protein
MQNNRAVLILIKILEKTSRYLAKGSTPIITSLSANLGKIWRGVTECKRRFAAFLTDFRYNISRQKPSALTCRAEFFVDAEVRALTMRLHV